MASTNLVSQLPTASQKRVGDVCQLPFEHSDPRWSVSTINESPCGAECVDARAFRDYGFGDCAVVMGASRQIASEDVSRLFRELATLAKAGVPMSRALDISAKGAENKGVSALVASLGSDVERGVSLAAALRRRSGKVDRQICELVEIGERSGTLESQLNQIAAHAEKSESLKKSLKKVANYSLVVIVVALISAVLVFEGALPSPMILLPALLVMVIVCMTLKRRSAAVGMFLDQLVLKIPLVGKIVAKAETARFARTLAFVSRAGLPLAEALDLVARAVSNSVYEQAILTMSNSASTGTPLRVSITVSGLFSSTAVRLVSIGEESGALDEMLFKLADMHDEDVSNAVSTLTSLIEPLVLGVLGIVMGSRIIGAMW